jgi:acyl-CoA synthetase (AMP-forming)/AMP-acid ligase II
LADGGCTLSWQELEWRTNAFGSGLQALGLAPGDHVLLVAGNRHEFVEGLVGAMRAGMVVTPAKTGLTEEELAYIAEDAGTRAVVTDRATARRLAAEHGLALVDLDQGYDTWLGSQSSDPLPADRAGWRLPYTSGTTGRPKGVVQSTSGQTPFWRAWAANVAFAERLQLPGRGWHAMLSRLYHGAPLNFGLSAMAAGAAMRILPTWSPESALDDLATATSTCMVPTMFRQLLSLPEERRRRFDPSGLVTVVHGGEPCPIELKRRMIEWWGHIFLEYFGFTEGGMTLATTEEWLSHPGTVGRPTAQRVVIRGPDGEELPARTEGQVYFTPPDGGVRDFSYLHDPDKTSGAHAPDGSFTAGDVGWVDEEGYLYISGRASEVIVSAGVNVYPAEVEAVIFEVPGVADACVVGGPDAERGEQVVAFVTLRDSTGSDGDAVLAAVDRACAERLAGYKRPRQILVRDAIPRDGTGKLLRRVVRDELWGDDSAFAAPLG